MTNNDVIVINGRRYDAITGKLLNYGDQSVNKVLSMDGVSLTKKPKTPAHKKISELPQQPSHHNLKPGRAHDIVLSKAVHSRVTAKPLMRIGLRKPSKTDKSIKGLQTPVELKQPSATLKSHYDPKRFQQAEGIHRSSMVKHFSNRHSSESNGIGASSSIPPRSLSLTRIVDPVTTQANKLQDMVDRGIQKASSHDQPSPVDIKRRRKAKKTKFRIFNIVIVSLAVILILGFVIYRSIPYIDVRIASAQSGVHAEIPSYIPKGFNFKGPIKYGQGVVTVIYVSKTASFRIIQQNSSWDSVGLRDSFVSTFDPNYKVVQAGGRIVYLYGQANATWVNGGVWYQITDNADLSTASLLKIVTSL
jgi:hypothetical protein